MMDSSIRRRRPTPRTGAWGKEGARGWVGGGAEGGEGENVGRGAERAMGEVFAALDTIFSVQ